MLSRKELELLRDLVTQARQDATRPAQAARTVIARGLLDRELRLLDEKDYSFTKREENAR